MRRVAFMGEPDLVSVRLTSRERATLRSAARILHGIRGLRDPLNDDDDRGVDLALAGYVADEVAGEGEVEA